MKAYTKDNNGHPESPINGELNGLFFSATPNGRTAYASYFGNTQLDVRCREMINQTMCSLRRFRLRNSYVKTAICGLPTSTASTVRITSALLSRQTTRKKE